jgi:hypothetical protein
VNILLICILHYVYISDNYALQLNHIIVKIHHSFTKQQIVHVCLEIHGHAQVKEKSQGRARNDKT